MMFFLKFCASMGILFVVLLLAWWVMDKLAEGMSDHED